MQSDGSTGGEPPAEAVIEAGLPDVPTEPARRSRWAALRRQLTLSQAELEEKYQELEERRDESAPIDVAFRVAEADRRTSGGLIAGGVAFRIYVVIIPFAFVLVTLFGAFGDAVDSENPDELARDFGMTGLIASAVHASTTASWAERILTLLVASYALVWSTWNIIRAARAVHGLAWEVESLPRLTRTWRAILLTIAGLTAAFSLSTLTSRISDLIDPLAEIFVRILSIVAVTAAWVAISFVLPRASGTTWRALVPGAVLVGVGVGLLELLTVYFFSDYIASKSATYGAIGASLAILLWAYLLGRLVVTAAFLNAARWRQREGDAPAPGSTDHQ